MTRIANAVSAGSPTPTAARERLQIRAAATLLRLALGSIALAHGLLKVFVFTLPGTVAFFVDHGYPGALAYLVTVAEVAGGLGLLAGVLVRWASLGLAPVFAGAALTVAPNGWLFDSPGGGGWEFPGLLVLAALVQALLGPGAWALGPALARRIRRVSSAPLATARA